MSELLTAEELANLREGIERRAAHPWDGDAIVARLLATLDHERAIREELVQRHREYEELLVRRAERAIDTAHQPTVDVEALANGIAYAIARAPLPDRTDTPHDIAARLAPLVIESGYLAALAAQETKR